VRYAQQRVQADPLLASLDFAYVHRMQTGFFRQIFLAEASLFAVFANGFSENPELLSRVSHDRSAKQEWAKQNTPNMGLFCSCI
jgi:hypothetical protein